ncbi:uncharacterized protein LOC142404023 [Mycteria americana]|uniref:uncharacterized protein LOC142404023 n=1 Tax=Mycteria americana TaxID=33587 RepID=UPI003F58480D
MLNKDSPIEWKEKCRMVRSGDGPVDEHCLPSTVEADLGELVDRYRRNAVRSYLKSSRLCKERDVHITDPALQKGEIKKVSVSYKKIHSDVPYSEEVVQNCMQETLNFFYFILRNREDTDFILKDVGTLAIRGTEVTMAFCEDFLLSLNKSTYMVEKLLTKKWVISDKEVSLSPSCFGRVYQFPQFEMRAVPRRASLTDKEILTEFESALSSMGVREEIVKHQDLSPSKSRCAEEGLAAARGNSHQREQCGYRGLNRVKGWCQEGLKISLQENRSRKESQGLSPSHLARAAMEEEAEGKTEGKGPHGRLLPKRTGTEGRQHKETPFESPELPLPTSEEHRQQTGQKGQLVFGLNGRRKLEASVAKGEEKEENREAGRVTLPKLPQQQAGTESDRMRRAQLPQEEEDGLSSPEITSDTEEGLQMAEAWIQARRQFRTELESLGDIEKWLAQKSSLSNQEKRCWQRIKAHRADRRAAVKSAVTDSLDVSTESSQPRKKGTIPLICAPYPQALVTLHNLLHKQKLRMVDVFRKAGMDGRKIKRADFVRVIKETKVPISNKDLEDVVIFLTSSKPGNFISPEDLVECQKQWLEMKKGQSQETKTGVEAQFQKATCKTATYPPSAGDTARQMKPHAPTKPERKLIHLENKDSPIEWKEKCRMVRSGDGPVDEHCLPSTVEADLGELVDRYRRNAVRSYLKSSRLCKERDVHITDPALQKALLHPGDKIIKEGEDIRKIRQPGGYYSAGRADAPSPGSTSRPGTASGSQAKEAENRFVQRGLKISPLLLPPLCITPLCSVPTVSEAVPRHLQRNKLQKSSDNNFWPGHLLDKLCLYFPEKQHDRAHALFSYVHPTRPAYHGI